jgi:hypothetical protein
MADRYTLVNDAMQTLHRTLVPSLIGFAPASGQEVNSVETGHLPYIFTWVGPGSLDIKGGGWAEEALTAEVFCFVEALGQNDLPSRQSQARTLYAAVTNLYVNVQNVRLLDPDAPASEGYQAGIETGPGARQVQGSGLQPLPPFGGRTFFGFRVTVPIFITWNPTTIAV